MFFSPCTLTDCRFYEAMSLDFPEIKLEGWFQRGKVPTMEALHCQYSGCVMCEHFNRFDLYRKQGT